MAELEVYVIGRNRYGSLSMDHVSPILVLTKVELLSKKNISSILCGQYYTIFKDNENYCWASGSNYEGQLGLGPYFPTVIKKPTGITFFIDKKIKIRKVCVNMGGLGTFWISYNNNVYANGCNNFRQLGISQNSNNQNKPILCDSLSGKHIIDVKSGYRFSIALSNTKLDIAIKHYWKKSTGKNSNVLNEIIDIIVSFYGFINVYSTGNDTTGACGHGATSNSQFVPIETFRNKKIVQIACGGRHSLFLETDGTLWAAGETDRGQLGFGHFDNDPWMKPKEISYFLENNIKIVDIACGLHHNLAKDRNGNVYAWGDNLCGQCGKRGSNVNIPKLIDLKGMKVQTMDCGAFHSYVETTEGNHLFFGNNEYCECVVAEKDNQFKDFFCIDSLMEKYNKRVKSVSLGFDETYLLLANK